MFPLDAKNHFVNPEVTGLGRRRLGVQQNGLVAQLAPGQIQCRLHSAGKVRFDSHRLDHS